MAVYDVELVRRIPQTSGSPTLTSIAGLRTASLVWTRECGAAGSLEIGSTVDDLDPVAAAALLDLSVTPCELWLRRDGTIVFAGPITGYEIRQRALSLHASGLLYYLSFMRRVADYAAFQDLASTVAAIVDTWQAQTFGHFGLDTTHLTPTGTTTTVALIGSQQRDLPTIITELGQRANGFDLEVDPVSRRLVLYPPRKGTDLSASVILDGRSIAAPDYRQSVAAGQIASEAYGSGGVSGGTLTAPASNTTLRSTFGRTAVAGSFQNVDNLTTLGDQTARLLDNFDQPLQSTQPGLLAVPEFAYGSFDTGDIITYSYDAGLGVQTFSVRVHTIAIDTNSGDERFALTFF